MPIRTASLTPQIQKNGARLHLAMARRTQSHGADSSPSEEEQALIIERRLLKEVKATHHAHAKPPAAKAAKPVKETKLPPPVKAPKAPKAAKEPKEAKSAKDNKPSRADKAVQKAAALEAAKKASKKSAKT